MYVYIWQSPVRSRLGIYITDVRSASQVAEDLPLEGHRGGGRRLPHGHSRPTSGAERSVVDRVQGPGSFLFGMVERRFLSVYFQRGLCSLVERKG